MIHPWKSSSRILTRWAACLERLRIDRRRGRASAITRTRSSRPPRRCVLRFSDDWSSLLHCSALDRVARRCGGLTADVRSRAQRGAKRVPSSRRRFSTPILHLPALGQEIEQGLPELLLTMS
jgi:hypothetical protein